MKKSFLGPNVNTIAMPFIYLAASVLLFVFVLRIGVSKISQQRKNIGEETGTQRILQQKESLLREVESDVSGFVDASSNAVPEKSPALAMVSQLKNLALVQGLVLTSFKIGSESQSPGTSYVELTFGVDGTTPNVLGFMQSLTTVAPVSTVEKAKINTSVGVVSANVSLRVYFAPFPTKLPPLTEPLTQLNDEEKSLLDTLSSLSLPAFVKLAPQEPGARANPFE